MANTTWITATGALKTTVEALALTWPVGTDETLVLFGGRLPEANEPRPARHRRFRFRLGGATTGDKITSGERDVVRSLDMVIHYDADQDIVDAEKMMAADEELLLVRLEREANRPSGIASIRWTGTEIDRGDPMHPVMVLSFEMVQALAQ